MNPLHQLTRRPVKAAFGVLLLALAGALPQAPFMQEYIAHNFVPGHDVLLMQAGHTTPAHAVRITQAGHLVVRTAEGEREVSFGEVSLRMQQKEEGETV